MSQSHDPTEGFVPFGGYDVDFGQWRPNQCVCGRSMSDRWSRDRCAFCVGSDDDE